jgi:hypothetical protein
MPFERSRESAPWDAASAPRRRLVASFDALLEPFVDSVNAHCFARALDADFEGIAAALAAEADVRGGILELDSAELRRLRGVDPRAVAVLVEDLARLAAWGREPQLNVVTTYPRDERGLAVSVDVHSFHVDRAPIEADTFLCTYAGPSSEALDNDDAVRLVDLPEVAAALRDTGLDPAAECFDLHFRPKPGAVPYAFGLGHVWRLAVDWPGAAVLPCIHRAPPHDGRPRLLLIA